MAATARALRPLLLDAPELHRRLAEEAGVGDLITRQGVLFVFPTRADFEAEALAWRLRRENGVRWLELSADELRQREPALDPALHVRPAGGGERPVPRPGRLCGRPGAAGGGAGSGTAARAGGRLPHRGRRLRAVRTEAGEVAGDKAVIAAGAWSHVLAAAAGDRVPLETERGYHAVIADPGIAPRYPVMPSDGKMAA